MQIKKLQYNMLRHNKSFIRYNRNTKEWSDSLCQEPTVGQSLLRGGSRDWTLKKEDKFTMKTWGRKGYFHQSEHVKAWKYDKVSVWGIINRVEWTPEIKIWKLLKVLNTKVLQRFREGISYEGWQRT